MLNIYEVCYQASWYDKNDGHHCDHMNEEFIVVASSPQEAIESVIQTKPLYDKTKFSCTDKYDITEKLVIHAGSWSYDE